MRRLAGLLLSALLVASCAVHGLDFVATSAIQITSPANRASVLLPLQITWTAPSIHSSPDGPYFAVFVDRAPVQPGQSLRALADSSCNSTPGCPDVSYLADRFVYVTDTTSVTVDALPAPIAASRSTIGDLHQATIVLIDGNGRRIGETAYTVEFRAAGDHVGA